jgi:hypothetical protein
MQKEEAFLTTALLAAHPLVIIFGMFGRPDHHAFIMLFILIYLYSVANILKYDFRADSCLPAAVSAALCVWISPETLIPILLTSGILFIHAFSDVKKLKFLHVNFLMIAMLIGLIVFFAPGSGCNLYLAMCILLMSGSYTTFHPKFTESGILKNLHIPVIFLILAIFPFVSPAEYDKISAPHAVLFTCGALFVGVNIVYFGRNFRNRITAALVWSAIIASVFLLVYPKFLGGMSANIDDYVKEIWLSRVSEMKSPFENGNTYFFIAHAGITLIAVIRKIRQLLAKKNTSSDFLWYIVIANAICYTIFSGMACRMLPYSVLFSLPLITDFVMNCNFTKTFGKFQKMLLTILVSLLFVFFTAFLDHRDDETEENSASYTKQELFETIDNLSKDPVVIMAHSNDGPQILYYTKHSVVGAPYHRQTRGIISSYKVMEDMYDEKTVKDIIKETGSSYIFIRKGQYKKPGSLSKMIMENTPPPWIEIVDLPPKFSDIVIAKIVDQ